MNSVVPDTHAQRSCTTKGPGLLNCKVLVPIFDDPRFFDQYAYKITGSTTGALVDITYKVSLLLERNEFVRCILVDFSKAFDTVDHRQLIVKLREFDLPACVLVWIVHFLTDRSQCTKLGSVLSNCLAIEVLFRVQVLDLHYFLSIFMT